MSKPLLETSAAPARALVWGPGHALCPWLWGLGWSVSRSRCALLLTGLLSLSACSPLHWDARPEALRPWGTEMQAQNESRDQGRSSLDSADE